MLSSNNLRFYFSIPNDYLELGYMMNHQHKQLQLIMLAKNRFYAADFPFCKAKWPEQPRRYALEDLNL